MVICKVLTIQTLASGSKGNATVISSPTTRILVDVGLTLPRLLKRLHTANIDPNTIRDVIVTHEHVDHVLGVSSFIKHFGARLHVHRDTRDLFPEIADENIELFTKPFTIGDIEVSFFNVPHDSNFCFGYNFKNGKAKISIAVDLGRVSQDVINQMSASQIVMLECNHDLLRLQTNKNYSLLLKRRITNSNGHLSNPACALAVYQLAKAGVTQIILAHLSEQNNSPTLAYECVKNFLQKQGITEGKDIFIDIASQNDVGLPFSVD